jgi:hypothetical protein
MNPGTCSTLLADKSKTIKVVAAYAEYVETVQLAADKLKAQLDLIFIDLTGMQEV